MAHPFNVDDLAETGVLVSARPLTVDSIFAYNPDDADVVHFKLFESASPTIATDVPWFSMPILPGECARFFFGKNLRALSVAATTQFGAGATAPAAALTVGIVIR